MLFENYLSRAAKQGGFKGGGFPIWTCPSFFCPFVLFGAFLIFPGFSRFARGWSGDFPDLSLSSFSAFKQQLRGTVPKGSATQSGPFEKKVGHPPVWKPPGLASSKSASLHNTSVTQKCLAGMILCNLGACLHCTSSPSISGDGHSTQQLF